MARSNESGSGPRNGQPDREALGVRLPDGSSESESAGARCLCVEGNDAPLGGRNGELTPQAGSIPTIDPATIAEKCLRVEVSDFGHPDDPFKQAYPVLSSFLFGKSWNGFEPRDTGVITLTVRPTGCTVTIKLPSEAQSITKYPSFVGQIWADIEDALINRTGDWN